jgi:hypothetical protein
MLFLFTASAQNPFDIQPRLADSLRMEMNTNSADPSRDKAQLEKDTSLFDNPFDVSHVALPKPIIKRELPEFINPDAKSNSDGKGFVFWQLLLSLLILVIIVNSNRSLFFKLFKSIPNENMLKFVQREENNGFSGYFFFVFVFFVLNTGLFVFLSLFHFRDQSGIKSYLYSLAIVASIYLIRHIILFFTKNIFPFKKAASTFSFSILLFNGVMSIFLLPVNAFLAFGPPEIISPLFYIGLLIIFGFYLIRQLRGFFIALGAVDFSLFHFFIYFCSCEIAPIFVILYFLKL